MDRLSFLRRLLALGAGIVVVGPSVLAEVHRMLPVAGLPVTDAEYVTAMLKRIYDEPLLNELTPLQAVVDSLRWQVVESARDRRPLFSERVVYWGTDVVHGAAVAT